MYYKQVLLVAIIYVSFLKHAQTQLLKEDECWTPSKAKGTCINLKNCAVLFNLLREQPRPPSTLQLLRDSKCGFEGFDPKVCCPPSGYETINRHGIEEQNSNVDTSYSYYREHPPNIENHPNLSLLPRSCGDVQDDKAFGGNKTGVFEFPWMALVAYSTSKSTRFMCGGSIINSNYILTAAHCVSNLGVNVLAGVRVGEHDISKERDCEPSFPEPVCAPPYQDIGVEEVIVHPNFIGGKGRNAKLQNDIALIRLNTPIDMNQDNIAAICLPVTRELQELRTDDLKMLMTGWGATETQVSSPDLLKINVPIINNVLCGNKLNSTIGDGVGFRQICAGGIAGVDSCGGDSGGPLKQVGKLAGLLRFVQHGIVSFGPRACGTAGLPGVYTRVAFYMDWLLDNLKP